MSKKLSNWEAWSHLVCCHLRPFPLQIWETKAGYTSIIVFFRGCHCFHVMESHPVSLLCDRRVISLGPQYDCTWHKIWCDLLCLLSGDANINIVEHRTDVWSMADCSTPFILVWCRFYHLGACSLCKHLLWCVTTLLSDALSLRTCPVIN